MDSVDQSIETDLRKARAVLMAIGALGFGVLLLEQPEDRPLAVGCGLAATFVVLGYLTPRRPLACTGFALITFVAGLIATWEPTFHRHWLRELGLPLAIAVLLLYTLRIGAVAEAWRRKRPFS